MELQRLQEEIQILSKMKRSRESSVERPMQQQPVKQKEFLQEKEQPKQIQNLPLNNLPEKITDEFKIVQDQNNEMQQSQQILQKQIQFLELQKEKHIQKYIEDTNFYQIQIQQLQDKLDKEKKTNTQNKELIKQTQKIKVENEKLSYENKILKKENIEIKRAREIVLRDLKSLQQQVKILEKKRINSQEKRFGSTEKRSTSLKKTPVKSRNTSYDKALQLKDLKKSKDIDQISNLVLKKSDIHQESQQNSCLSSIYQKSELDISQISHFQDDISNQICNLERQLFSHKKDYSSAQIQEDRGQMGLLAQEIKKTTESLLSLKQKQKEFILNSFTK